MKRYEAFISKNWRDTGVSNVAVARIDDDGGVSAGFFLVDHFCLGVKDAFLLDDLMEDDLREIIEERFPEGEMERMHPAWAKKFVEGATAYAENLGFSPHRDYRKARRALGGIDSNICTETFVYGDNGRPHYIQGEIDDETRATRVLAVLDARLGPDGYVYTLRDDLLDNPDIFNEALLKTRDVLKLALKKIKNNFTVFMVAGIITAMLCMPDEFTPDDVLEEFRQDEDEDGNPSPEQALSTLDGLLELYWAQLKRMLASEMKTDDPWPFDIYEDDFPDDNKEYLMALLQWFHGFLFAVEVHEDIWAEARARPELAGHWKIINQWGKPSAPGGLFEKLQKKASGSKTDGAAKGINPHDAVVAIYRALRPEA